MRTHWIALTLSLCVVTALAGQAPAPPAASITKASDSVLPYTIESLRTRVRLENDGGGSRQLTFAVKVLDEQAVRQWGQVTLPYQSDTEALDVKSVQVEKPDGSVSTTTSDGVQDLAVPVPGPAPVFTDLRQKTITVSALRPGDLLKVDAVWTTKKPIAAGQFWFEHTFDTNETVRDERLEIDVPAARKVILKTAPGKPQEEHDGLGTVADGRRVYRWKSAHVVDDSAKPKVRQPDEDEPAADVRLTSFQSWDEFARWFGALAPAIPDATVNAKVATLTAGLSDQEAKLATIYRYVATEIRYVSLSFGLGRYAAHPPGEVLAHQYGDCKDKAVLLQSMLSAAGLRSVPVLVNAGRSIADDLPSPLEFDHMMVVIPRGPDLGAGTWLDATMEVAPAGMLALTTRGKRALAIDQGTRPALVRTPLDPPFASFEQIDLDAAINAIGVLAGKLTYTVRGDSELALRTVVRAAPRSALTELATALATANGLEGEASDVSTSDPADTAKPFQIAFQWRQRGALDWAAAQSDLAGLLKMTLPYGKDQERKDIERLYLGSPNKVHLHANVRLPSGYDLDAPQPMHESKAGLTYSAAYKVDGRTLVLDRELAAEARTIPASAIGEYSSLAAAVESDAAQRFKVHGHATGTPEIPADATADELYKAAYSAYEAKRYDAAVALWKRNTELAPKSKSAWDALGLAYNQLHKYDEAAAAIQKQIDLDPYEKRAYGDLGLVLKNARKRDAAIRAYAKHVELNALDGSALKELGILYNQQLRYPEAAATLERAAVLLTKDLWVLAELGAAYSAMHETAKATTAFDRALAMSPNLAVRTKIAWEMAESGGNLARAEELARQAEKEIVDETRNLDLKSLKDSHLDHAERLAWLWDVLGWIRFQKGDLVQAERYVRAAWQLSAEPEVAFHLGQISEKQNHLADALSFYLTAQALSDPPSPQMVAHVKKLAGGGDLQAMLKSAREVAMTERAFKVPNSSAAGAAEFLALVGDDERATEVRFFDGPESFRGLVDTLKDVIIPLQFPADSPLRLPVGLRVACVAGSSCRGMIAIPSQVRLTK
jgi:tetratricopeptide (TPR) repeat protein